MTARFLKSSILISHITWPNELKLCRMIRDIGAHSRSVLDVAISSLDFDFSSQGALWGARLSKYSNLFTTYISYPDEPKFGRMILDSSPLDCLASDCSISPRGAVNAPLEILKSIFKTCSSYPMELKLGRMVLDISPLDRLASDCSISTRGRCGVIRLFKIQID